MTSWRVWFAFEARPGITIASTHEHPGLWEALVEACRRADGSIDCDEYDCWMACLIKHSHLWGAA